MLATLLSLATAVQAKHLKHTRSHFQTQDPASQILKNIPSLSFYQVNSIDTSAATQPVVPVIVEKWSKSKIMVASKLGDGKILVAGVNLLSANPFYSKQIDLTTLVANSINYVSKRANCASTPGVQCKVLLVGRDQTGVFMEKAQTGDFAIQLQITESLQIDDISQYDLIYLNQRLPLSDEAISKVQEFVRNGGGLLVEYAERFNFDANNNANRVLDPTGINVSPSLIVVATYTNSKQTKINYKKIAYSARVLPTSPDYQQQYDSYTRIVNGVSTLNAGYKFSTILKDQRYFEFLGKTDEFLGIGGLYGSGKLIVISSDDYATSAPSTKDTRTKTLMANIKTWFGKASPRVGGLFGLANCNGIPNTSYNVISDAADITTDKYDIICLSSVVDAPSNIDAVKSAVEAYVKAGGNLFVASSSGKWIAKNGNADFKKAYPVNAVLRQFGIVLQEWESTRASASIVKPSSTADKVKAFLGGEFLDVLSGKLPTFASNLDTFRSVITKTPAFLFDTFCGVELYNKIMDTFEASPFNPQNKVSKCNSQPWSTVNQIMRQLCDNVPLEVVRALPSSLNSYPGRASPSAKAVKTVSVPLDYPNRFVYSGMYVNPGEPFSITFEDGSLWQDFDPKTFTIRINNNDVLTEKDCDCGRSPNINYEFVLKKQNFVSPIGGFLYFDKTSSKPGVVKLRIDAYEGNYYNENLHSVEDSKQLLSKNSPFVIVECDTLTMIGRGGRLVRKQIDAQQLCSFWNDVMTDISTYGFQVHPYEKQIMLLDVNIEVGFMHAGNPIMGYESQVSRILLQRHVKEGEVQRMNWVYYHELGHQQQDRKWTESKSLEVTNLIYAVQLSHTFGGIPLQELWNHNSLAPGYFNYQTSFSDNFVFLDWYVVLMESFGIDFYKKVQNMYNEKGRGVANSLELYNQMCRIFSDITGLDMYSYFDLAKMPVDAGCKDYVNGRPVWHNEKYPFLTDYDKQ